jgi:aerobic-type carbon monoxide dehydrogenase small subunit (CoxS/CutS family)
VRPSPSAPASRGALVRVSLEVNGRAVAQNCNSRHSLLDLLRVDLGLTGTKRGCDNGECGACTVLLDGRAACSCLTLAVTCDGASVDTIEGLAQNGVPHAIQRAFAEEDALQCGICTPGQIMSLKGLLDRNPRPSDDEIKAALAGNLCRCGAYPAILRAARRVVREMAGAGGGDAAPNRPGSRRSGR